jgi:hypothetical protein
VHEEEVNVAGVANEEGLVAGGHHVAGLLVGAETNLCTSSASVPYSISGFAMVAKAVF